jgi:hypothetical protein
MSTEEEDAKFKRLRDAFRAVYCTPDEKLQCQRDGVPVGCSDLAAQLPGAGLTSDDIRSVLTNRWLQSQVKGCARVKINPLRQHNAPPEYRVEYYRRFQAMKLEDADRLLSQYRNKLQLQSGKASKSATQPPPTLSANPPPSGPVRTRKLLGMGCRRELRSVFSTAPEDAAANSVLWQEQGNTMRHYIFLTLQLLSNTTSPAS